MVDIPIPVSSSPGIKPQEGAGRLINCFAEKAEAGARFPVIWRRSAGLRLIKSLATYSHLRGAILVGSTLLLVLDNRVQSLTESGGVFTATDLGALSGTDVVTLARDNAATPKIVCVGSAGCFNLFTGSAPTAFVDADLPAPNSVSSLDGYFIWTIGDGRIFASDLNAVSVSSLSFTQEQGLGTLLRGVTFRGEFFAFGQKGCGVYKDIGSTPFPLQRQFEIEKGIAGTNAIAGWEEGWVKQLIWVGEDGIVYRLNGYTPDPISNDDVTRVIAAALLAGDGASLEATVHMQGKHAFWRLTNPGVWSWEYNATTQNWNERQSFNQDDIRACASVWAFTRWIQGDRDTGTLFQVDESYYREADNPLVFEIQTGIVAAFPARLSIPRADFDFATGVGLSSGEMPIQTDPQVQISWSRDGGYSFGNPVNRALGAEGAPWSSPRVLRVGMTNGKGLRFKLRVSDPVHAGFMGGQVSVEQLAV